MHLLAILCGGDTDFASEKPRKIEFVIKREICGNVAHRHTCFSQELASEIELAV